MIKKALPVILMLALLIAGCDQPQAPPMALVPFTSQAWSIRGVAPEGWVEIEPGHFSGAEWPFKQLMYEFFPGQNAENVIATAVLPRLGIDALPETAGANANGVLDWDLYATQVTPEEDLTIAVDLALAETDSGVYMVGMVTGTEADVWDMMMEEVYQPIGIARAPIMRTVEENGQRGIPQAWVGLYPTVDDVAKVAILLRNGGQHRGKQLLHAGKLAEALRQTEVAGLPTGEFNDHGEGAYHMTFWSMPYRNAAGDTVQIPYMSGFGGNRVIFNPNGIVAFQFADAHVYGFESMVKVAEGLAPFGSQGSQAGK